MELSDFFEIVIELEPQVRVLKGSEGIEIDAILERTKDECGHIEIEGKEFFYLKRGNYLIVDSFPCLKKELEECRKKTLFDGLTGCFTKIQTEEILKQLLKTYIRYKQDPFSLIALDLDHFKKINDTYGHLAGDYVLKEFAKVVKDRIRASDICGRIGGEEFLVILPNTKLSGALRLAERVRRSVEAHDFIFHSIKIPVTVSLGITSVGPTDSLESLLSRVDEALYDAKKRGRNRVEYR